MTNISVCLLSGGLDSCVAATLTKQGGDELYLLSINWGQTSVKELESAKNISEILQPKDHKFLDLMTYNQLSQSALTGYKGIPNDNTLKQNVSEIPATYPPGRDPSFIMIASSWLESIMLSYLSEGKSVNSGKVVIGTNKEDSIVYPDCNPEVYKLLNSMLKISTKIGKKYQLPFGVKTPLIELTKKEVIKRGLEIGAPLQHTWSCYKGEERLCGECDQCRIIYFAFKDLGIRNPFEYQKVPNKRFS